MKVVVDTNIIFSALLNSQSNIAKILLNRGRSLSFYSPGFLKLEIFNHFDKIKKLTQSSEKEILELVNLLYSKVHFITEEFIPKETVMKAEGLTRSIDFDDVMFVALAIHLDCSLWTG